MRHKMNRMKSGVKISNQNQGCKRFQTTLQPQIHAHQLTTPQASSNQCSHTKRNNQDAKWYPKICPISFITSWT
eukprot:15365341-Ditylum_brightwellii.AAC.1